MQNLRVPLLPLLSCGFVCSFLKQISQALLAGISPVVSFAVRALLVRPGLI